jgi:thiol-disulfide isomerase/thioredoxin
MRSSLLRSLALASYIALGSLATLAAPASALDDALRIGAMEKLTPVAPRRPPVTGFARRDGTAGDLSDYAGDVVVLNFWATWCAPCRAEMPSLQALQDALGDEGLEVVTVAFGRHNPVMMERFWEEAGISTLPLHLDAGTELARGLGVQGLPHSFVLDREGRVIAELSGETDWAAPETLRLMQALLDG